jgi:hypothetical protein
LPRGARAHGFVAVPAAPATVGAYLASLAGSHAPTTIRRRLSALGKMHRFNDLAWNPAHRDIRGPLQGALRTHGGPVRKAAVITLAMLRQILATCDQSARGRRDRALLFGLGLHNVVISRVNPIPHAITVYASDPALPRRSQHSLPGSSLRLARTGLAPVASRQLRLAHRVVTPSTPSCRKPLLVGMVNRVGCFCSSP